MAALAALIRHLRRCSFAVLATSGEDGVPHAVGVEYGLSQDGRSIFVMTRRQLRKARDIARNPNVAIVVPLQRRLLWFVPPPCVQFNGSATILDRTDPEGLRTFRRFFMGRRILKQYEELERRGETRVCFLRIELQSPISTYMVGHSIWEVARRMDVGAEEIVIPAAAPTATFPDTRRGYI